MLVMSSPPTLLRPARAVAPTATAPLTNEALEITAMIVVENGGHGSAALLMRERLSPSAAALNTCPECRGSGRRPTANSAAAATATAIAVQRTARCHVAARATIVSGARTKP